MKKQILVLFVVLFTTLMSAQVEPTIFDKLDTVNKTVDNLVGIEETVVYYFKEAMELTKDGIEGAIDIVLTETPILVKQFLWFKAIEALLPVLLGLFLLTFGTYYVRKKLTITKTQAEENYANAEVKARDYEKKTDYYVAPRNSPTLLKLWFNNYLTLIGYVISTGLLLFYGATFIIGTGLIFIKIAFFPKLYLVEFVTQYLS